MRVLRTLLLHSVLSDKIFGLSLQTVQLKINKTPHPLKVNVQLTNDKRSDPVPSVHSFPDKKKNVVNVPKAKS